MNRGDLNVFFPSDLLLTITNTFHTIAKNKQSASVTRVAKVARICHLVQLLQVRGFICFLAVNVNVIADMFVLLEKQTEINVELCYSEMAI